MLFDDKIFIWRFYTINKTLSTIKQVQIIDPKKFVIIVKNNLIKIYI